MLSLIPLLLTRCLRHQPARSAIALAIQAPPCSASSWQCATLQNWHHAPQGQSFSSSASPEPKEAEQSQTSHGTTSHAGSLHVQQTVTTLPNSYQHTLSQDSDSDRTSASQAPSKPVLRNPIPPIHTSPPTMAELNQQLPQRELPELGMHVNEAVRNLSPSLDEVTYQRHAASLNDGAAPAESGPAYFPSKQDDGYGVQTNWFKALFQQLNLMANSGQVPHLKGRNSEVFRAVETEFETLYVRHIVGKSLDAGTHRALLMVCLSIATHRVLSYEVADEAMVREIIRTNLGGIMTGIMKYIQRFQMFLLISVMGSDPYKEAIRLLPAVTGDMGPLCDITLTPGPEETTLLVNKCIYHSVLVAEQCEFLITEFCCHSSMTWLRPYQKHGVGVSMDRCMAWEDSCCSLRIARTPGLKPPVAPEGQQAQSETKQ